MEIEKIDSLLAKMHGEGYWIWVVADDRVEADKNHPPQHTPEGYWEYVPSISELFEANKDICKIVQPKFYGFVNEKGFVIADEQTTLS